MAAPSDAVVRGLDRGGIWELAWKVRLETGSVRQARALVKRWEKLTGRRYYG